MDSTINTVNYFIAGYVVIFGSILFYILSLIIRWNNLKKDLDVLSEHELETRRD
jgi:hypothetical protein